LAVTIPVGAAPAKNGKNATIRRYNNHMLGGLRLLILVYGITSQVFLSVPVHIKILLVAHSISIFFVKKNTALKYISIILLVILGVFQLSSTRLSEIYRPTPLQIEEHQQRLDIYPRSQARLAHWTEDYLNPLWLDKLKLNFFDSLDFVDLFTHYFPFFLFPFFIFGLYQLIKRPSYFFVCQLATSLFLLTLISPHGLYGPFLIFPQIIYLCTNLNE